MSLSPVLRILFLLFFLISMCESNKKRNVKIIKNADFQNKHITEIPMKTLTVRSKMECLVECRQTDSCLSFSFNDGCKVCSMYDKDFVNVAETATTDEMGWNFYYIIPGYPIDRSKCELLLTGICQSFCLFYRKRNSFVTVQDIIQPCDDNGGDVIKVDRYLKQYCVEKAIDPVIGADFVAWDGVQDESTGIWTYFDGTTMSYFHWNSDPSKPQPDYVSPTATPGAYQGFVGTREFRNYLWHDVPGSLIDGVLCEIRQ